jgi:hypothetical protein
LLSRRAARMDNQVSSSQEGESSLATSAAREKKKSSRLSAAHSFKLGYWKLIISLSSVCCCLGVSFGCRAAHSLICCPVSVSVPPRSFEMRLSRLSMSRHVTTLVIPFQLLACLISAGRPPHGGRPIIGAFRLFSFDYARFFL